MPHQGGTWPSEVPSCGPGHPLLTPTHVQGRPSGLREATSPTMMEVAGLGGPETRLPGRSLPEYRLRKPVSLRGRAPAFPSPLSAFLVLQRAEGLQVPLSPPRSGQGAWQRPMPSPARRAWAGVGLLRNPAVSAPPVVSSKSPMRAKMVFTASARTSSLCGCSED